MRTVAQRDTNSEKSTAIGKNEVMRGDESMTVVSDQLQQSKTFYEGDGKNNKENSESLHAL